MTSLEEVNRRHVSDLERTQGDLTNCHEEIEKLQNDRHRLSDRFHFFQTTRGYFMDLIDCLSTKVIQIYQYYVGPNPFIMGSLFYYRSMKLKPLKKNG